MTRGAGGDPFHWGSREALVFLRTLYFPLQAASVFIVLMNSRRSYRTYQDPGLSPFKLTSNDVMAAEHRGFQKPQACCGHKLEHSLSRARREEATDKFFPPGSPQPGCTAHSQGWRPGYPWQPKTSARSLRLQDHAGQKHRSVVVGGGVLPAASPQTEQRWG